MTIDNTIVIDKWFKVKEIMGNVYQSKMEESKREFDKHMDEMKNHCEKTLMVIDFIQKEDKECKIQFLNDEEGNSYNVKIDFDDKLQFYVDKIMETGEIPEIKKTKRKK